MANYRVKVAGNAIQIEKTGAEAKPKSGIHLTLAAAKNDALLLIDEKIADLKACRRAIRSVQDKELPMEQDKKQPVDEEEVEIPF